jgi:hypothetical protein
VRADPIHRELLHRRRDRLGAEGRRLQTGHVEGRPCRSVLAGSVITAFRKVEPALNSVAPWRSMIDEKRPACGNSGEPSATIEVMPERGARRSGRTAR